jgi:hypothetical protein
MDLKSKLAKKYKVVAEGKCHWEMAYEYGQHIAGEGTYKEGIEKIKKALDVAAANKDSDNPFIIKMFTPDMKWPSEDNWE